MLPSLHRKIKANQFKKREAAFAKYLQGAVDNEAFLPGTPAYARPAILQHYGINTKWLDVVDNIWVALWFACHEARVLDRDKPYVHFVRRRRPYPDQSKPKHAYVFLIQATDVEPQKETPGLWVSKEAEMIDLRIAAPSLYIRPHAQHGLLVKKRNNDDLASSEFGPMVVGILRVEIGDALDWIGGGSLLSAHTLFPPPYHDFGYHTLLCKAPPPTAVLGGIQHIGA